MEKRFRIIPVLDLKDGIVVHGIRGERDKYQPICSKLTTSTQLIDVLKNLYHFFGFTEYYIADLDRLVSDGRLDQLSLINSAIKRCTFPASFMLDTGVRNIEDVARVLEADIDKVVIGTETLISMKSLAEIIDRFGTDHLIASIDIKDSKVLSPSLDIAGLTPPDVIREIRKAGVQEFILLQLNRVGTGTGLDKKLIEECSSVLTNNSEYSGKIIIGGGVGGFEDLKWLADHGIEGALVASALHNANLNMEMVQMIQDL